MLDVRARLFGCRFAEPRGLMLVHEPSVYGRAGGSGAVGVQGVDSVGKKGGFSW